ncbi:MAG: type I DNA topoisomerase, partial [Candidatus Magasanikbacteria bacterium]|nr:type I DNA topoisomerase [Candidatus Magasanikbacteria bacterium]
YEGVDLPDEGAVGLITYMRTDSVNLAEKFLKETRQFITATFGEPYLSTSTRRYQTKSKLAQEAHEAIRPTDVSRRPESLRDQLEPRQWKLYDLIWKRAVATQMAPAKVEARLVDIVNPDKKYSFRALGIQIKFDGFLKIYPNSQKENLLPSLKAKDKVQAVEITPKQHFTEPPARYSDATLVKALEEYGIGRPSTYAPTISTIIARQYVERVEKGRLKPREIALLVNDILVEHFPQIVDYQFTAKMEDSLDEVAKGEKEWPPLIRDFYEPFKKNLQKKYQELSKKELTEEKSSEICEKCGSAMVIKLGRFGRFLACGNFPKCKNTKSLNGEIGRQPKAEPVLLEEKCPQCQSPLTRRRSRYGEFISCSAFPKCKYIKEAEEKTTGVKCPECQKGEIIERHTRRRKIFYSCSRYPDCKFALWQKPINQKCLHCGALMVEEGENKRCSNKACPVCPQPK